MLDCISREDVYIGPGLGALVRDQSLRKKQHEGQWFHFSQSLPVIYHTEEMDVIDFWSCAGWPTCQSFRIAVEVPGALALRAGPAGWLAGKHLWCANEFFCGRCPPKWASSTHGTFCFIFAQYGAWCDPLICLSSLPHSLPSCLPSFYPPSFLPSIYPSIL